MKLSSAYPVLSLFLIPSLVVAPLGAQSIGAPSVAVAPPQASSAPDNTDLQLRVVEGSASAAKVNTTPANGITVLVTNAAGAPVPDTAVALRLPDSNATGTFADGSHAAVAYTDATGHAHFAGLHWSQTPGAVAMRITATKGTSHAALQLNETLTSDVATVVQVPAAATPAAPPAAPQPAVQQVAVQQPGQPAATTQPAAHSGAAPVVTPIPPATKPEPTVSVSGASPDSSSHSSKTKWIIIAAVVAAAAGAGVAVMGKGKSTSNTSTTNSLTIGTPSVSVGHQ